MLLNLLVRTVLGGVLFGLALFWPAGTLAWPQGWIFIVLFMGCGFLLSIWLWATDPDLLAERMKSPLSGDQKLSDRVIITAFMIAFTGWFVFAALDAKRFGWSATVPVWLQAVGAFLIVVAFYGWFTVMRVNSFASVKIKVQAERKQTVISTGPYAIVRHPMYSYALLMIVGGSLLLGSLWGLLGLVLLLLLLAARIRGEEEMLCAELDGYGDYAQRVRYRLVPGIW